jgi:hypothetical protein
MNERPAAAMAPDEVVPGNGAAAESGSESLSEAASSIAVSASFADSDGSALSEVGSPAKIIRIGAMVKQMLEEVRSTDLDEAARDQLRVIYDHSIEELGTALSPDLASELRHLSFDFSDPEVPTEAELRMAKAQLVGWLEGLFHGIQATLVAQQMAARQQLEGVRGEFPSPPGGPGYI